MNEKLSSRIDDIIRMALEEDIRSGDITTEAIIDPKLNAKANFLVKQDGIIAGIEVVRTVFHNVDHELIFINTVKDGERVLKGKFIGTVEGKASSILSAERTALNFLQRMSGIATYANQFAERIKHTRAKIIDTRKTVPGLRLLDKMAVRIGGCENHRMGLYDMFLIKDNHIEVAGSITKAIEACREYSKRKNLKFKIEVETKNPDEVREALNSHPDVIMLDNFTIEQMKEAVNLINGKCKIEASGGINLETVKDIAETGVDFISVGAVTHSIKALDISLEIITE